MAVTELWRAHADRFAFLAEQAEALGPILRDRAPRTVVSHRDAHLGNVLVAADGQPWPVDWDGAALAPPERDLMFVIGGVLADLPVAAEQKQWFFDGYGPVAVDATRLAYFTCARALEDVAGWAQCVIDGRHYAQGDRADALEIFRGLTAPTGIVTVAEESLRQIPPEAWST